MNDYILEDDSGLLIDYIPAEQIVLKDVPYWFFEKGYELRVWNTLGEEGDCAYLGYWKYLFRSANLQTGVSWVDEYYVSKRIAQIERPFPHSKTTKYELDIEGFIYVLYQIQFR